MNAEKNIEFTAAILAKKILATERSWEVRMFARSWNPFDVFAIKTLNSDKVITGHLPREISRVTKFLLDRGAVAYAELTSTHYRRSSIMQGCLEIPCKITVKLHGIVTNHMPLDRYMQLVNSLYCQPKEKVIMGSFFDKNATSYIITCIENCNIFSKKTKKNS